MKIQEFITMAEKALKICAYCKKVLPTNHGQKVHTKIKHRYAPYLGLGLSPEEKEEVG